MIWRQDMPETHASDQITRNLCDGHIRSVATLAEARGLSQAEASRMCEEHERRPSADAPIADTTRCRNDSPQRRQGCGRYPRFRKLSDAVTTTSSPALSLLAGIAWRLRRTLRNSFPPGMTLSLVMAQWAVSRHSLHGPGQHACDWINRQRGAAAKWRRAVFRAELRRRS